MAKPPCVGYHALWRNFVNLDKSTHGSRGLSPTQIADICRRLSANKRVRRTLPAGGRLHIDRQLPFLCVYRQPLDHDDSGTGQLVKGEASYLVTSAGRGEMAKVSTVAGPGRGDLESRVWCFLVDRGMGRA